MEHKKDTNKIGRVILLASGALAVGTVMANIDMAGAGQVNGSELWGEKEGASSTAGKVRQRLANAVWRMILEQGDYHYLDYDGDGTLELAVDNLQDNGIDMCIFKYIPEESRVQRLTGLLDDTWHLYDAGRLYREDVIQNGGEGYYWLELGEGSFSRDYPLYDRSIGGGLAGNYGSYSGGN